MDSTGFWQYSLNRYAIETVKEACLALQDSHGYNVNLLLFCMLCDSQKRALSIKVIAQIKRCIENSDKELNAHRAQRNSAKALCGSSATQEDRDAYQGLLTQELSLEAKQQELIAGIFAALNANENSVEQIGLRKLEAHIQVKVDAEKVPYDSSLQSYVKLISETTSVSNAQQNKWIEALREHV